MQKCVQTAVGLVHTTTIFNELNQTVVVVITNGYHGRSFLEFIDRVVGKVLLLQNQVHDISVACSCE